MMKKLSTICATLVLVAFGFSLFSCLVSGELSEDERALSGLLDRLLDTSVYSKRFRPNYKGPPVRVNLTLYLYAINKVDELNMEVTYTFFLKQTWNDPRLAFNPMDNITDIYLTPDVLSMIWKPDTFFYGFTDIKQHPDFNNGGNTGVSRIKSNGNVEYNVSLTLTMPCQMRLQNFPADQQACDMVIGSSAMTDRDLIFQWSHEGFKIPPFLLENPLPNHRITYHRNNTYTGHLGGGISYTKLEALLYLERTFGYYLYQIYVPAFLVVIISWIPFWLERDHHARVGLGVTTVLTITTLITNTMSTLPKVSYVKSLDTYLFTAFFMVFLSLVEYAIVGFFETDLKVDDDNQNNKPNPIKIVKQTSQIDRYARVIFPAIFFAFNAYYICEIKQIFSENELARK